MAKIHNHDKTFIRYKNLLMVHETPVAFKQDTINERDYHLSGCGDKGLVKLGVHFPKNVFYNNEIAVANVQIDNSKSSLDIKMVDFEVK